MKNIKLCELVPGMMLIRDRGATEHCFLIIGVIGPEFWYIFLQPIKNSMTINMYRCSGNEEGVAISQIDFVLDPPSK